MATPDEHIVQSLKEYLGCLEEVLDADDRPRWYRGVGRSSYTLKPGLFRPPSQTPLPDLFIVERHLFQQFKLRSRPHLLSARESDWELLFLMQHHRMPTRLLDWTENALVALYFTLEAADREGYPEDAAVWCLDPISWNDHTFKDANPPHAILTVDERRLDPYASPADVEVLREPPIAIYAPHSNDRIVAQSGTFAIYGNSMAAMEELWDSKSYPKNSLTKLVVPRDAIEGMFSTLMRVGYTHSRVFPDLDGLAVELRRAAGFPA